VVACIQRLVHVADGMRQELQREQSLLDIERGTSSSPTNCTTLSTKLCQGN
jgi:hypothetical protein